MPKPPFDDELTAKHEGTKIFGTDNHVSITTNASGTPDKKWGICGSMSTRWIKESLKKGSALAKAEDIGTPNNIAITQGAWVINAPKDAASMGKWLLDTFNLKGGTIKVGKIASWRTIGEEAARMPGYLLYTIKGKPGGHAMGFFIGAASAPSYYFDPNAGLYRYATAAKAGFAMANHMKVHYDGWKDGEYKLYPVTEE